MNNNPLLSKYASFLISERFEDFVRLFFEKAKSEGHYLSDLPDENKELEEIRTGTLELLQLLAIGQGKEYIKNRIDLFKRNKLPSVTRNYKGVAAIVSLINVRKFVFIKLLKDYTSSVDLRDEVIFELNELYSFYFLQLIEAYSEMEQEKVLQEKEFTQSIINNTVDGIAAFDLDLNVTEWNPVNERDFGIKKEDIVGKNYYDFFPQYKNSNEAQLFKRVYSGESIYLADTAYKGKPGWYDAHFVPLYNKSKDVIGAMSISHDITRRKEAEIKVQEDKIFIQALTEASPDVITVYDLKRNQNIYSSKEIYEILGYSEEELKELVDKGVQGLVESIHPEDLGVVLDFIESYKSYEGDEAKDLEYRIKDHRGNYRWISDRYNVFKRSEEGLPTQIIGVARDNTLRKLAEEKLSEYSKEIEATNEELRAANETIINSSVELEKSRDYYIRILNDFPSLIWRANTDAKCDYFNNEWLKFTGRTMEQELGDGWAEGVHPDDTERCMHIFLSSFRERIPFVMEYRMKRWDGCYRWIIDIARPLYDINNVFIGYLGACFDIHDKKEFEKEIHDKNLELSFAIDKLKSAEETLIRLNNELEERVFLRTRELTETNKQLLRINADLDNFIYTASHDLKAPILNIEGLTSVLDKKLSGKLNDSEKKLMDMIGISVNKFKRTIIDLTEISKVQKNIDNDKSQLSFKKVLDNVNQDIQILIQDAGNVIIEEDLKSDSVYFVERNLRSIFYNLLSNAIKYRSADVPLVIRVATFEEDKYTVLTVSDNGLGIEQDQIPKIFEMFKRMHNHTEGTGVGLYILKRIVENNDGKIEVESTVGKGSTFKIYFKKQTLS